MTNDIIGIGLMLSPLAFLIIAFVVCLFDNEGD